MKKTVLSGSLLAFVVSMSGANAYASTCISIRQDPVVNTNFTSLRFDFLVHADTKWTGLNQSTAIDETFTQSVTLDVLYNPQSDFCNNSVITRGNLGTASSHLTDDVSQYAGRDFSVVDDYLRYTVTDGGYVSDQYISYSVYNQSLTLEASDYTPNLDEQTGQYFYSNYTRGFSTGDLQVNGYYTVGEDLQSYLNALLGSREFIYYDVATLSQDYISFDKYGYTGTAILTGITTVPLPAAVWLFGSGLLWLIGIGCRHRQQ